MLPVVPVRPKRIDDYAEAAGREAVDRVCRAAEPLHGARLLQVSGTGFGGGVNELLQAHVPLLNDLVLVHDPQPAALLGPIEEEGGRSGRWLWRCHIGLSAPFRPVCGTSSSRSSTGTTR